MSDFDTARKLLADWKGNSYLQGNGVLDKIGPVVAGITKKAALIYTEYPGVDAYVARIKTNLAQAGVTDISVIVGAAANAPKEDLQRIADELAASNAEMVISFGGGSTIDAAKAAEVLRTLGGSVDQYFGTNLVTEGLKKQGKKLHPHMAIQTAASTGAHLTKYSNITDYKTNQKKLIVDPAIVPTHPVFDYEVSYSAPISLTSDGALDGIAHIQEVIFGLVGKDGYGKMEEIAKVGIKLILEYLPKALENPKDAKAREALCLATDLGGYAIMVGGTNGPHLTSFSLVDILTHGRACALMNPYYTVFFSPAIEKPLRLIAGIYKEAGCFSGDPGALSGRKLGDAFAEGMFAFAKKISFPTRLSEVKGFTQKHIDQALAAAKDPQLKMKLENMPVPLTAETVDEYMGPILAAARDGNIALIKNIPA
ncbi:MAG: iron-containing alcohol dehydrogenase [Spirochaetia bacterium]|nr:iron-containing alcohol dehydrogenase [Spirochaetia bacterium]